MRTAVEASRLALPGFVIPFAFIYQPELLLGTGHDILASMQSLLFVALAVLLISRACYPSPKQLHLVPVGLGIAFALLFLGTTISWIAAGVAVALLAFSRFAHSTS